MFRKIPTRFFTKADEEKIIAAIQEAERLSSGEIRVHLARDVEGDILEEAAAVFLRLKMHQTEKRNGVLFLFEVKHRRFALYGDSGIHARVGQQFWNEIRDTIQYHFRRGNFLDGLVGGIRRCGEQLQRHFPANPSDVNELRNDISRD